MVVYLINRETNEVICKYSNVIAWDENFVEYLDGESRNKSYCDVITEYFTDIDPAKENDNETELIQEECDD